MGHLILHLYVIRNFGIFLAVLEQKILLNVKMSLKHTVWFSTYYYKYRNFQLDRS